MQRSKIVLILILLLAGPVEPARAVEGPAVAGPIGGTDMRSALMPPPGLYGGVLAAAAGTLDFVDGEGDTIPAFRDAHLTRNLAGPFLYFVPDVKVFGGSVAIGGLAPAGNSCGHILIGEKDHCTNAIGDPYVELQWARSWAIVRQSRYAGAYPILEGLSILLGLGIVIPVGQYDAATPARQATSIGTNIWDVAPTVAMTYTTAPVLAEGTEFSAKLYWNNYWENPDTRHRTGDVVNVDFAITERMGRWQAGLAGFYAIQVDDDAVAGAAIDGMRAETLQLGAVVNYDMPEHASSLKLKALTSAFSENTVYSWGVAFGWVKKF